MIIIRLFRIGWAVVVLLTYGAVARLRPPSEADMPRRLRATLERLGPTFVKLGQALSLRPDLLSDDYIAALRSLQDHAAPFPAPDARREIERGLRRPIETVFAEFESEPMAAASIAQVHRARLADGRAVIVKVRRPGIGWRIDRDMRTLRAIARIVVSIVPRLRRFEPVRLLDEIWTNLRKEIDFRTEAKSTLRFAEALRGFETINVPAVIDDLYSEAVLVQEMSGGLRIDDPGIGVDGPRLAQVFVDLYLHQFLVVGVFHADPHPGNLFIMADGRICFHDFGLVGFLDHGTRRALAMFMQAFVRQDAGWLLDAAIDLRLLGGPMDRVEFERGIEEILADYAALPLKEWSIADAFLRVARLGRGENINIPHNLLLLMRALYLVEAAIRTLDPEFKVLDSLIARGEESLKALMEQSPVTAALARIKYEAAITMQDLPAVLGAWLHRAQREGDRLPISIRHQGLESLEAHIDRSSNRLALAMVTLGVYVAASLLMLHGAGPRIFGDIPLFAAAGYALALWLSIRLVRAISGSGRL